VESLQRAAHPEYHGNVSLGVESPPRGMVIPAPGA
jgi:hypothetical protein